MIKYLFFFPVFIIILIVSIGSYLQPNDLKSCNNEVDLNSSCQKADAIIAISGGDTNARTDKAIDLYKNGWADKLIFAGAAEDKSGPSNAKAMQIRAEKAGIPTSKIFLDESSETTHENAVNVKSILDSQKVDSIILVTSGYHQRRASIEFQKSNPEIFITNSPADNDRDWSAWWWTGPRGWTLAVTEIFKIILFYLGVG